MFDDLVVSSVNPKKTNKSWTVVLSTVVQAVILGVLILIPFIYTEALPKGLLNTYLVAPAPPPPPPPPQPVVKEIKAPPKLIPLNKMTAPSSIPKKVEIVKEEVPSFGAPGVAGGIGDGGAGVLGGILGSGAAAPPPPKAPTRVRVGGAVENASLTRKVDPIYPAIAKTAHVQGTVLLHAVIGKDGSVQELQYVSGPSLLMKAAMDAVKDWRYKPLLLNGEPTEVETEIQVIFTLSS